MIEEVHHNCGIAAVSVKKGSKDAKKALFYLYKLLLNQQNRGQLSAGITTFDHDRMQILDTYKDLGTVNEVFKTSDNSKSMNIFKRYAGFRGIGHVRYATSGNEVQSLAQPFERHHGRKWKWYSFCWNGNLANYMDLKKELLDKTDYHITYHNDTEILMHCLSRGLKGNKRPSLVKMFSSLSKKLDGCFNIAYINAFGEIVVCRDPTGFRPVVYGWNKDIFLVASESNALRNCGVEKLHHLEPGHLLHVTEQGKPKVLKFAEPKKVARCMFEWVYFANVSSVIDKHSVYITRTRLGKQLAREEPLLVNDKEWIVVPVPDTAKPAADAYAFEKKIKSKEGLIRNRFVGRTFIEGSSREDRVKNKFTALREILEGKKVILIDDSVVRGTTIKQIVAYMKKFGRAKELHLRITCPPIRGPCFYGIDMSTIGELLVPHYEKRPLTGDLTEKLSKKMAKDLGVDSIRYQSIGGLVKAINFPSKELCLGCINGKYPTPKGKKLFLKSWENHRKGIKERSYSCS